MERPQLPAGADAWTERRKADREAMAAAIEALALYHGATVSRELRGLPSPRELQVHIQLGGLALNLDFDGMSCQPDIHVCAWHIETGWDRRLAPCFSRAVGWAPINACHRHKCTAVAYGFEELWDHVDEALALAASEEAFEPGWEVYASPRIALALFSTVSARSGEWRWPNARWNVKRRRHGANVRLGYFPTSAEARNFSSTLAEAVAQRFAATGRPRYHGGEIFLSTLAGGPDHARA